MPNYLDDLRKRIRSIELLRMLKRYHSYEELSSIMGYSKVVLNRYIKGHVLPASERADEIIQIAKSKLDVVKLVKDQLVFFRGYFDTTMLLGNTSLLKLVAQYVADNFKEAGITKICAVAPEGLPMAVHLATELGTDIAIAKRTRDLGVREFVKVHYPQETTGELLSLNLPKGLLTLDDRVLIIEDSCRTGTTLEMMVELVKKSMAKIGGVFVLAGMGDKWKPTINRLIDSFGKKNVYIFCELPIDY
ncbi:MAG TPA: phosphoribosyltransferase family protein [candidate division Zixibacteria bacterium]|nr:phosphoribosyltransferase family protein [candidate division Zixibacteria bacterium]